MKKAPSKDRTASNRDGSTGLRKDVRNLTDQLSRFQDATKIEFQNVDGRFSLLEQQISGLDQKVLGLDQKVLGLDQKVLGLDQKISDVKSYAGVLHEETLHKLDLILEGQQTIVTKGDDHERRIDAIEEELPVLRLAVNKR